ncbi:MAG: hypothetical protein ACXVJT_05295, partial [Thermoanaerobaculia bacterium]
VEAGLELLHRLASNFQDLIIVAGGSAFSRDREKSLEAGATYIPTTLAEAKEDFLSRKKGVRRKAARSLTFSGLTFRVPPSNSSAG